MGKGKSAGKSAGKSRNYCGSDEYHDVWGWDDGQELNYYGYGEHPTNYAGNVAI